MIVKSAVFHHAFDLSLAYDKEERRRHLRNKDMYTDKQNEEIMGKYDFLIREENNVLDMFSSESSLNSSLLVVDTGDDFVKLIGEVVATLRQCQSSIWSNYPFELGIIQDLEKFIIDITKETL